MRYPFVIRFLVLLFLISWQPAARGQVINRRHIMQPWTTDTTHRQVPLHEFRVLLTRDAIRPIDTPRFIRVTDANVPYYKNEPVCVVRLVEGVKAYPLSVLMFHEIINDKTGGIPLSVTYCPLCNSVRVFDCRVPMNGKTMLLDFGTTGMLRKSNLVMWDRQSETWWQQFTGIGLVGKYAGISLPVVPSMILPFGVFRDNFPAGRVLAMEKNTHTPPYGMNPYVKYDSIGSKPRLFFGKTDTRLPAMERVAYVHIDGNDRAYPYHYLREKKVVNDRIGKQHVVVFYRKGMQSVLDERDIRKGKDIGTAVVFIPQVNGQELTFRYGGKGFADEQTGSVWTIGGRCVAGKLQGKTLEVFPYSIDFAFALFAFCPETVIYNQNR